MQAREFIKALARDRSNLIERLLQVIHTNNIRYCVIGGVAVSAYAEPLVSLDLDLIVASYQLGRFESLLASAFLVKRHSHFIEINSPESDVRVYVHTSSRYSDFVQRGQLRPVLGMTLPVAAIEDVLQAKVWAFQDTTRSRIKRQKDLLDIARLIEAHPRLGGQTPPRILAQLQAFEA